MRKKILVVDDQEISREILCDIFSDGYDVDEAENGAVAIDILSHSRGVYSAMLLDIMMPVKDGFEVLEYLHENNMTPALPVLLITGSNTKETALRGLRLGAVDVITKPYDEETVRLKVDKIIALSDRSRA